MKTLNSSDALQHIRDNIDTLIGQCPNPNKEDDVNVVFLKEILNNSVLNKLVEAHENLTNNEPKPIYANAQQILGDTKAILKSITASHSAREFLTIVSRPHFRSLLDAHDLVAKRRSMADVTEEEVEVTYNVPIRVVGLRKVRGEPLGFTVECDEETGNLIIARILAGGLIDKQGLLHVGDVIVEVNDIPVYSPEELAAEIAKSGDSVTLKIAANDQIKENLTNEPAPKLTCYMRALFDYDPQEDTLLPCREIGLPFCRGDVLQIVDKNDPIWWQARKVDDTSATGLIPSQELEERRKAFVPPEADYVYKISICGARISKKKKKRAYQLKNYSEFDKAELLCYEEVTRMPPFKRKTLVLIGPKGVGRRTLKSRLITNNPDKFGTVVPYTSRPQRVLEENGKNYWFVDRETIDEEIRQSKFLEYGEHNEHVYGTHFDSIRDVIRDGKMCILDCSPDSLKILHNSQEFMPFVIFIAAPGIQYLKSLYHGTLNRNLTFDRQSSIRFSSRRARTLESLASLYEDDDLLRTLEESAAMQRKYGKYIDLVLVNEDFDKTFTQILDALKALQSEHQWIPVNWVY